MNFDCTCVHSQKSGVPACLGREPSHSAHGPHHWRGEFQHQEYLRRSNRICWLLVNIPASYSRLYEFKTPHVDVNIGLPIPATGFMNHIPQQIYHWKVGTKIFTCGKRRAYGQYLKLFRIWYLINIYRLGLSENRGQVFTWEKHRPHGQGKESSPRQRSNPRSSRIQVQINHRREKR